MVLLRVTSPGSHWDWDLDRRDKKKNLSYLREERARDKLFVLQKGDALAAIQLLGQVSHVCLQLCKAWKNRTDRNNPRSLSPRSVVQTTILVLAPKAQFVAMSQKSVHMLMQ